MLIPSVYRWTLSITIQQTETQIYKEIKLFSYFSFALHIWLKFYFSV